MVTSHVSAKPQYFTSGSTFVQVDEGAGLPDICTACLHCTLTKTSLWQTSSRRCWNDILLLPVCVSQTTSHKQKRADVKPYVSTWLLWEVVCWGLILCIESTQMVSSQHLLDPAWGAESMALCSVHASLLTCVFFLPLRFLRHRPDVRSADTALRYARQLLPRQHDST